MKIIFDIIDDYKLSSVSDYEIDIDEGVFSIAPTAAQLKPICKTIAKLNGYWSRCEIENIRTEPSARMTQERAKTRARNAVIDFAQMCQIRAQRFEEDGYDGLPEEEVQYLLAEFFDKYFN